MTVRELIENLKDDGIPMWYMLQEWVGFMASHRQYFDKAIGYIYGLYSCGYITRVALDDLVEDLYKQPCASI